jgi:F-box-like
MTADLYGTGLMLQRITIGSLPDEILLEIFHFKRVQADRREGVWEWHTLVHVCRRWRRVVFASPVRLNLELYCTDKTPVREMLHIWPELPLFIDFFDRGGPANWNGEDRFVNIIDALEHRDRVHKIHLTELRSSEVDRTIRVMQQPFPALTSLNLCDSIGLALPLAIPDTFLNGSAPSLQDLQLWGLLFPSLPRLLSSATHLTSLHLFHIPNSGYISPESMATSLSALTNLEILRIHFTYPTPHSRRRDRPRPAPTRAVLPALTDLEFLGVSEWLEDLAGRVDAPLLVYTRITFFNQFVIDIPQIVRFIQVGHIELSRPSKLSLRFNPSPFADVNFYWPKGTSNDEVYVRWRLEYDGLDWQVRLMAQLCKQILPLLSNVDELNIKYGFRKESGAPQDIWPLAYNLNMDPAPWLELLQPFLSVKSLEILTELEPFVAAALQGLTEESAAEILPALEELLLERFTIDRDAPQGIQSFITARQHSDHPVAVYFL